MQSARLRVEQAEAALAARQAAEARARDCEVTLDDAAGLLEAR